MFNSHYGSFIGAILNTVWISLMNVVYKVQLPPALSRTPPSLPRLRPFPVSLTPRPLTLHPPLCLTLAPLPLYKRVAVVINDLENHRTATEHEDALIIKTLFFQVQLHIPHVHPDVHPHPHPY